MELSFVTRKLFNNRIFFKKVKPKARQRRAFTWLHFVLFVRSESVVFMQVLVDIQNRLHRVTGGDIILLIEHV